VNIVIQELRFWPACLNRKDIETHRLYEKLHNTMLHGEKFVRAVRSFAKGNNPGIANHFSQELDIAGVSPRFL
jgi:hypothetical protein